MRIEDLLDVIGEVDEELLERSEKTSYKRKGIWMKWGSLAACVCLVVAGVWAVGGLGATKMENATSDSLLETAPEGEIMNGTEAEAAPEELNDVVADMPTEEETSKEPESAGEPDYGINPLQGADPMTSALSYYKYDGDQVTCFYMYDNKEEQKILDLIAGLEYEEIGSTSQVEMTYPIYGMEIGRADGWSAQVAWSNGYWFTADGAVLEADFNMGSLETDYEWKDANEFDSMTVLPCAKYICQIEDGWRAEVMTPSDQLAGQENVTMSIVKQNETAVNVEIRNDSKIPWEYGQAFSIQVLLNDVWYDVPMTPGNWAFTSELLILPEGESVERSYGFNMYGELPMGTYRLVVEGLTAEFEIE